MLSGNGNRVILQDRFEDEIEVTDDGELMTTVTERENNVTIRIAGTTVGTGSFWFGLIDLSDTVNWPHANAGRIDVTAIGLNVDKAGTTQGQLGLGVLTRVSAVSSDVEIIGGYSFLNNDTTSFLDIFNLSPAQLKCSVANGRTDRIKTNSLVANVTAINSSSPTLSYGSHTWVPAVGDLVLFLLLTNNSGMSWGASLSYHSHP
jgi:hypothetical protein